LVAGGRGRQLDPGSFWGLQTGPNPTDRAKLGSQRHLICDGRGVPLAIQLSGANRNDSQQALSLVDAIPSLQGERGRPHTPVLPDLQENGAKRRKGIIGGPFAMRFSAALRSRGDLVSEDRQRASAP
jgi:hypothetical protein